jgi:hypothetical protein
MSPAVRTFINLVMLFYGIDFFNFESLKVLKEDLYLEKVTITYGLLFVCCFLFVFVS